MIVSSDFNRLAPNEKAALIYQQAKSDVATRLWRAALGSDLRDTDPRALALGSEAPASGLDMLLGMFTQNPPTQAEPPPSRKSAHASRKPPYLVTEPVLSALPSAEATPVASSAVTGLGPNFRFSEALASAAARTNIPAAALAAIVDAEAAKSGDGSWQTASRNPRSSAAGLGQFLGGTWQSEAERAGTWLHGVATSQGWLGEDGRVLPAARSALLALRYDATASINATADYASRSMSQLKRAGIAVGEDLTDIARTAYLGHHLGTADAVRFLTGGLSSDRARQLLGAQVGSAAASQRIAQSGDATSAHRTWLLDFVNRRIRPARFAL